MADTEYIHPNNTYIVSSGFSDGQLIRYQYYNSLASALLDAGAGTLIISYDPVQEYTAVSGVKVVFIPRMTEANVFDANDGNVGDILEVQEVGGEKAFVNSPKVERIAFSLQRESDILHRLQLFDSTGSGSAQSDTTYDGTHLSIPIFNGVVDMSGGTVIFPTIPVLDSTTQAVRGFFMKKQGSNNLKVVQADFTNDDGEIVLEEYETYIIVVDYIRG